MGRGEGGNKNLEQIKMLKRYIFKKQFKQTSKILEETVYYQDQSEQP